MPSDANNPTQSTGDDDRSGEWTQWDQTFRNARPLLPDVALARIEASVRREAVRLAEARAKRPRRIIFFAAALVAAGAAGWSAKIYWNSHSAPPKDFTAANRTSPQVRDEYPLDLPIEPPNLSTRPPESGPRPLTLATVQAQSKTVNEGVATYGGSVTLSAGPWRISCDKLTAFRSTGHAALLNGIGTIHVTGISRIADATADEITFNTENGDLKLSGKVHLAGEKSVDESLQSCTISRLGDVRDREP